MNTGQWFSSKVRLVCLIEPNGGKRYQDSVFVFRERDFESAFLRALDLGRSCEKTYQNGDGNEVRWRLKEIISLDIIGRRKLDGAEVYSEPVDLEEGTSIQFEASFNPEKSQPTQTF